MTVGSRQTLLPADIRARLAGFTELAATAIANAQARAELRGYAEGQAALRRVAMRAARAVPPQEASAAVAEEVVRLLKVDYAVLRRVSIVAYRTRQLADATRSPIGDTERAVWERNEAWQPTRKALEKLLAAYDWGECFTAMNLVLRPTLDQILLRQLANVAHDNNDDLTWLLLGNLAIDADRCTRWSTALAQYAVEQRAGNRDVLQRWVARWTPRAQVAAAGFGQLFEQLPSGGRAAETVENAANWARRRVLGQAGLAE